MRNLLLLLLATILVASCNSNKPNADEKYLTEINQWHKHRIERLKSNTGWLNLKGLFWLEQGENALGSDQRNNIVFPEKAPAQIGTITLKDSIITFKSNNDTEVKINNEVVKKSELKTDMSGNPTILANGSLRWFIIKRGDKYGIRLRDFDSELVKNFEGIERFPVDTTWRVKAEFIKYKEPKVLSIPNIIGQTNEDTTDGYLQFTVEDKNYKLDPLKSGDGYFLIFADGTSGKETYGAGRFLYVEGSDNNEVIIDFNKAYNPPCAFTKFATCPLPPKDNYLKLEITAGEKKFGNGHH